MHKELQKFCTIESAKILDAIRAIDQSDEGFTIVVNPEGKVQGMLTDGDIRRALLAGAKLDQPVAPYIHKSFFSVGDSATRTEVLDLMQARKIRHVPVIDEASNLLGIHFLSAMIGAKALPNWAVLMAGGKGTRLHPLTEHLPKPMIKVAGRPILERLVLHLVGHGVTRIFLSVNYLGQVIEDHFGDGARFGCAIEYLREPEPLGTGGALSLLPEKPAAPLLVMNGDLVIESNIEHLLNFHNKGNYYATMAAKPYQYEVPYGCVDVADNRIISLKEKPISSFLVNAGVYVLSPEAVAAVPSQFFPITQLFEQAIELNRPCGCYKIEGDWADVGQVKDLKKARGQDAL